MSNTSILDRYNVGGLGMRAVLIIYAVAFILAFSAVWFVNTLVEQAVRESTPQPYILSSQ